MLTIQRGKAQLPGYAVSRNAGAQYSASRLMRPTALHCQGRTEAPGVG
jgi:hypothetical protein